VRFHERDAHTTITGLTPGTTYNVQDRGRMLLPPAPRGLESRQTDLCYEASTYLRYRLLPNPLHAELSRIGRGFGLDDVARTLRLGARDARQREQGQRHLDGLSGPPVLRLAVNASKAAPVGSPSGKVA